MGGGMGGWLDVEIDGGMYGWMEGCMENKWME